MRIRWRQTTSMGSTCVHYYPYQHTKFYKFGHCVLLREAKVYRFSWQATYIHPYRQVWQWKCKWSFSLCQRLGLTRSVRNKPRARSASIEHQRRESPPEVKDKRSESFAGGARGFAKQNRAPLHHEGANTIFSTKKKLSLDKRLVVFPA